MGGCLGRGREYLPSVGLADWQGTGLGQQRVDCFGSRRSHVIPRGIERTIVLLRLITLGVIFGEFCELTRGEPFDADIIDWADSLEICPVRVGQVLGPKYLEDSDDPVKLERALLALIDQVRPVVSDTLVKGFGNESTLFLSLWRASEGGAIDEPEEDADSVLNEVAPEKMKAFEWINEGMPNLK